MKKLLLPVILIILCSCSSAKLATVSSESVQLKNSSFVFENDTVKITYRFWADRGIMRFDIYNKLDEAIYFDWKNSAFIPNDQMVSYWQDATNTVGVSSSSSSWLYGGIISQGVSKSIHQERIGVIPPHSLITKNDFKLVKTYAEVPKSGDYNKDNSFLNFRNYLMFSTNEKFEGKPITIDNHFYVSNIRKINYGKKDSYKKQNSFVIKSTYAYK